MKTMLYMMPAMMLFVCWSMPAGLCLYWAFFSVLSIIQQYFMNKQKKKEMEARAIREAEEKEKRIAAKKAKMTAEKKAVAKQKTQIEQAEEAASEDDDADIRCIKD
jgi:YidC/Oxa1 family membrane protein insertase